MARRASSSPSRRRPRAARPVRDRSSRKWLWWLAPPIGGLLVLALASWLLSPEDPQRLRDRAEAASRAGDWKSARRDWRLVNETTLARARTHLAEARACLALDQAGQAERALRLAIAADPSDPEPWRLLLELLRVEDRPDEAQNLGWEGYAAVPASARRGLLRDLSLALLADLPEDLARSMLDRWTAADRDDSHAQVARLKRMASMPRSGDPDRAGQIEILASLLEREPKNLVTREALISALAEAGEPDRGRQLLEAWPAESRDSAPYARLRGRWDLDFDRNPEHALAEFDRVLTTTPHDWKTHYRRARALQKLGRVPEARQAAETMSRLRERLDPAVLGPRLGSDLARLTDPKALADLAELCAQANLGRLAEAWRKEAAAPPSEPQSENANAARGVLDLPLAPSGAPRPR